MPTAYITTDSIGPGALVLGLNEDLYVASGVRLISVNAIGVSVSGASVDITVFGHIAGESGITCDIVADPTITVQAGGSVTGTSGNGITNNATSASIINHGTITGFQEAVRSFGEGAQLINFGLIQSANQSAVEMFVGSGSGSSASLVNFGTIVSTVDSTVVMDLTLADRVENRGLILGGTLHGGGADVLMNSGTITGSIFTGSDGDLVDNRGGRIEGVEVDLGLGADTLDNRGGTILGVIQGGTGSDTFRLGAGIEIIDGGADFDSIDFRGTPAVTVALDGSIPNTGHAAGDEYTGIEGVFGSYFADLLIGSAGANTLRGYGGNDTLEGGAGSDKIVGGNGIDTATGGAGSDVFVFDKLSETGDVITDFNAAADAFNIRASAFGGGLVAGGAVAAALFRARADNVAQDGDDRFIFRTTDRTLWFDADGNGAGAAVMVADLQAGAALTAADIVLI